MPKQKQEAFRLEQDEQGTYTVVDHRSKTPQLKWSGDSFHQAEMECSRLNMAADDYRSECARCVKELLARHRQLFVYLIYGRSQVQSIVCLVADNKNVLNVSSSVADALGFKWNNNDSVKFNDSHALARRLSYMLYKDENKIDFIHL